MNHHDADLTDVVVVLEDLTDEQTLAIVEQLKAAGLAVTAIDNDKSTVEGAIDAQKVHGLKKIEKVRYVRSIMTYTVDYPPGDPRDLDGAGESIEESED